MDYYDPATQAATSVKSTNLFSESYQDISILEDTWRRYVDDLDAANFPIIYDNVTVGGNTTPVNNKVLHLIMPTGTPSSDQQGVLDQIIAYANSKGITVTFEKLD